MTHKNENAVKTQKMIMLDVKFKLNIIGVIEMGMLAQPYFRRLQMSH